MTIQIIALEDEKSESQLSASDDDVDITTVTKQRKRLAQLHMGDMTDDSEEEPCKTTKRKGKKSGRTRTVPRYSG